MNMRHFLIRETYLANSSKSTSSEIFSGVRHFRLFAREKGGSKERAGWNVLRLRRAAFLPLQNPENWNVDRDLHKCVQIINDKITY